MKRREQVCLPPLARLKKYFHQALKFLVTPTETSYEERRTELNGLQ